MRVQWMGSAVVLALALAAMGCSSSSSSPTADAGGGTDGGASTDGGGTTDGGATMDGGGGTDAGAGSTLATPVTVTMAMLDANHIAASICQQTYTGDVQLSLAPQVYDAQSSSPNCPTLGEPYITFYLNTSTGTYTAKAGYKYDATGLVGAVTLLSTTQGSLSSMYQATSLPADTSITIVTGLAAYPGYMDGTVTFQLSGNDVTVTAFTQN